MESYKLDDIYTYLLTGGYEGLLLESLSDEELIELYEIEMEETNGF